MKMSISTAIEERTDGDDDTSQESQPKDESDTENDNGPENQNGGPASPEVHDVEAPGSPEVHEITSDDEDDCILTNDEINDESSNSSSNGSNSEEPQLIDKDGKELEQLTKHRNLEDVKRYDEEMENGDGDDDDDDDESDVEEVSMEDPLNQNKAKPIVINDTKSLVELASKQSKSNDNTKEPTVVIIDTNSIMSGKGPLPIQQAKASAPANSNANSALSAQNLCQSIAARGTTITPVSSKSNNNLAPSTHSTATIQPPILPSLTDDMFVVEAPSFIVPYVYEKPSVKPFREFVDTLGKELDELKAKEEKARLEKEKAEKERKEKERQERKERGEDVEGDENEKDAKPTEADGETKSPSKKEKKKRRKIGEEEEDVSWDGESNTETDASDEDDVTVIKEKDDSIQEIKDLANLTSTKVTGKSDSYFDCSLGQFFINIGINLVQEYVQSDLLKQQNRKLYKEKKTGRSTKATEMAITSLTQNLQFSKKTNAPYALELKRCEHCSFKTESMLVMSHHLEAPHMRNNIYKCNSCAFEIRSPHDILFHMEAEHNLRGRLERAPAYQQCANCMFEDNSKSKLARHLIACAKKFKPELNLMPPLEWEPPAKIPKLTRQRNNMNINVNTFQGTFNKAVLGNNLGRPIAIAGALPPGLASRPRGRPPMSLNPRGTPLPGAPLVRGGLMIMHNAQGSGLSNYPAVGNSQAANATPKISITPLPRSMPPQPIQPAPASKGTFVICEICDGYIKDLEQLRNHMQWIHKVKIHPKMIYNRPPLNCQKCQFRFFTDQGLERHLLGSHGLVTSSMQEAANKGKDAGRCPVCGRVYQWKLLNHVARDHSMTLKPAHLSYKCTVCTATFGMYKQFENHVYSAHSVVAKRVMDKSKAPAKPDGESLLKPIKINDEITIIPQPAKPLATTSAKDK